MSFKIDAKMTSKLISYPNQACDFGAFWVGPGKPNAPNDFKSGSQLWDPFRVTIWKITSEKASQNWYRTNTKMLQTVRRQKWCWIQEIYFWRLGGGGWVKFKQDFSHDFNGNLTRPAPQAGCGGSKIDPNRSLWGHRFRFFIFGGVFLMWKNKEFWSRQNSINKLKLLQIRRTLAWASSGLLFGGRPGGMCGGAKALNLQEVRLKFGTFSPLGHVFMFVGLGGGAVVGFWV